MNKLKPGNIYFVKRCVWRGGTLGEDMINEGTPVLLLSELSYKYLAAFDGENTWMLKRSDVYPYEADDSFLASEKFLNFGKTGAFLTGSTNKSLLAFCAFLMIAFRSSTPNISVNAAIIYTVFALVFLLSLLACKALTPVFAVFQSDNLNRLAKLLQVQKEKKQEIEAI